MLCQSCAAPLVKWQKSFCSRSCAAQKNNRGICRIKRKIRECEFCGTGMGFVKRKYCNRQCRNSARRLVAPAKLRKDVRRYCGKNSGYVELWFSDGTRISEHRYVMEQHLGRKLSADEHVHHRDGQRNNNDLSNLEVLHVVDHARLHATAVSQRFESLVCGYCKIAFERPLFRVHHKRSVLKQDTFYCSRKCGSFGNALKRKSKTSS